MYVRCMCPVYLGLLLRTCRAHTPPSHTPRHTLHPSLTVLHTHTHFPQFIPMKAYSPIPHHITTTAVQWCRCYRWQWRGSQGMDGRWSEADSPAAGTARRSATQSCHAQLPRHSKTGFEGDEERAGNEPRNSQTAGNCRGSSTM